MIWGEDSMGERNQADASKRSVAVAVRAALSGPHRVDAVSFRHGNGLGGASRRAGSRASRCHSASGTRERDRTKEDSESIIDSVVADEAGMLPDNSITEVLQRVSGVEIVRFWVARRPGSLLGRGFRRPGARSLRRRRPTQRPRGLQRQWRSRPVMGRRHARAHAGGRHLQAATAPT